MTTETTDSTDEPTKNELWTLYRQSDDGDHLAVARVLYENEDDYHVRVLYDSRGDTTVPYDIGPVSRDDFYAPLPDHDEWSEKFEDLLDYTLGLITRKDAAEVLAGESIDTNGERGYEAARFFALDGIFESITEWSVHQGHGPSRYGRAVQNRVADLPEWMTEAVLESELHRWEGGFVEDGQAAYIVEVRLIQQELLDHDHEEDIRELVSEFDLEYDDYREVEC